MENVKRAVLLLGFCLVQICCNALQEDKDTCTTNDPGTISSCFTGDTKGKVTLEVEWQPQNITAKHQYSITIKQLSAPAGTEFDEGTIHLTVWIPGLEKPLYNRSQNAKCKDVFKIIPDKFKFIEPYVCPLKFPLPPLPIPYTLPPVMTPEIPVPMGSYRVRAVLYSGDDEKEGKQPFICIDGWLIFSNVNDNFYTCNPPTVQPTTEPAISQKDAQLIFNSVLGVRDNDISVDHL